MFNCFAAIVIYFHFLKKKNNCYKSDAAVLQIIIKTNSLLKKFVI